MTTKGDCYVMINNLNPGSDVISHDTPMKYNELLNCFFNRLKILMNDKKVLENLLQSDIEKIIALQKEIIPDVNKLLTGKVKKSEKDIKLLFVNVNNHIKDILNIIGGVSIKCDEEYLKNIIKKMYSCANDFDKSTKRVISQQYENIIQKYNTKNPSCSIKRPEEIPDCTKFIVKDEKTSYYINKFINNCELVILNVVNIVQNKETINSLNNNISTIHKIKYESLDSTEIKNKEEHIRKSKAAKALIRRIYNDTLKLKVYCDDNNATQEIYKQWAIDITCYYSLSINIIDHVIEDTKSKI